MQQPIAILDSGVGGLTVAKEVMRQLPQEKLIYFGDTARTPYGSRPAQEVGLFTRQIIDFLMQYKPKMIVIACNTATAVALEESKQRLNIPVIGVVHPGARAAIKSTRKNVVGVIGTEGTIKSGAYERALKQISPSINVISLACPTLVPLVESGLFKDSQVTATVAEALKPLLSIELDCLILGCTHYPFLMKPMKAVVGPNVRLISSADETAREISTILYHRSQLAHTADAPVHQFFSSGDAQKFHDIAVDWLGEEMKQQTIVWQTAAVGE